MEKRQEIVRYRERLDKTLSSTALKNEDTIKSLIKDQLINSSQNELKEVSIDNIVEKRTSEVSNFLDMLRSTSINDHDLAKSTETHGEWKLKQDTEEFRVMYREGSQGTPFHALLVEGYVDAPVDACLCISWESELYKKWWPQYQLPSFKVTISKCLQRVRINEQISLVRMKLTWPLSTREAVVHYYVFEYLEDDLIVVLVNTIPDLQSIDKSTHGYTNEGIPEAKDVVRIEMVGGFALQKVTPQRSYFRTITSMDMKLDFVPPSLINFISRHLVGNGFLLYKKSVTSVSNYNEDFITALRDPLYTRLREAFYTDSKKLNIDVVNLPTEGIPLEVAMEKDFREIKEEQIDVHSNDTPEEISSKEVAKKAFGEIEEDGSEQIDSGDKSVSEPSVNLVLHNVEVRKEVLIRPEVEQALGILDKAISMLREYGINRSSDGNSGKKEMSSPENKEICSNGDELSRKDTMERISHDSSNTRSSSCVREANHNRIAPASPEEYFSIPIDTNQIAFPSSKNWTKEVAIPNRNSDDNKKVSVDSNSIQNSSSEGKKLYQQKRWRFCCFTTGSGI